MRLRRRPEPAALGKFLPGSRRARCHLTLPAAQRDGPDTARY